eukprot:GFKZ01002541.1.p1 GENE.GFKZ01002541.1~~GFKZ01002541.1.p1  ORF type:complete len:519 (+),score=75.17 GFKZ01002541.1:132-1559(+)
MAPPKVAFSLPPFLLPPYASLPHLAVTTLLSTNLFLIPPAFSLSPQPTTPTPNHQPIQLTPQPIPSEPSAPSAPSDPEHTLADEVWSLLDRYYLDQTFNNTSWPQARLKLAQASLPNRKATYATLRSTIRTLNDRYTRLLTPSAMKDLLRFDVSGVGLLLTSASNGDLIVATNPAPGTPAANAGIVRGDVMLAVDGVSVVNIPPFEVSHMMQGREGTDIQIELREKGTVRLTRSFQQKRPSVREKLVDSEDGKLGYIRLDEFRASAREEVGDAARRLLDKGAQWLLLDLRGNGGGVFEGALEIAGLFEGRGVPVVRVLGQGEANGITDVPVGDEVYVSRTVQGESEVGEVELGVVVDGSSASASEVLTGGLRDACRAAVVGERTYGKGLIQGVFGLSDGGGLVITVAEYQTPGGGKIQGVGLEPDIERKLGGWGRVGKAMGVERLDETTVKVSRAEIRAAVARCKAQKGIDVVER